MNTSVLTADFGTGCRKVRAPASTLRLFGEEVTWDREGFELLLGGFRKAKRRKNWFWTGCSRDNWVSVTFSQEVRGREDG